MTPGGPGAGQGGQGPAVSIPPGSRTKRRGELAAEEGNFHLRSKSRRGLQGREEKGGRGRVGEAKSRRRNLPGW